MKYKCVAPLRLLLPKATETKVKVLLCVAMETVGEDGHVTLVTSVSSAEKQRKYSHQPDQVLIVREDRSYANPMHWNMSSLE